MPSLRPNAIRIKRFRELKESLRTERARLLVGIDIAKVQHVAQVRLAHTRILDARLGIANTQSGFAQCWAHLERRRAETGCPEVVCAVEPTGAYHAALAQCLEAHGADVVLVAPAVAHLNRRTQDGTWDKSDPKDAANLGDLLEQGKVLFYALPEGPAGELRPLVRLLRQARTERAACKARWRNTLRPAPGPAGEPLPARLHAALPALLQGGEPAGGGPRRGPSLGPGLAAAWTDLAARVRAVQQRIAALEAACVQVARALPALTLLQTSPGVGPTVAALLLAEIGDVGWFTKCSQLRTLAGLDIVRLQSGQWAGTGRISRNGRPLLRWALYQAALGATRTAAGRAAHAARLAKRAGDRHAGLKAMVEGAAAILRTVWGVWRSGVPYDPTRAPGRGGGPPAAA